MPTTVIGVATEDARKYFPQFFAGLLGISAGATVPATPAWNPLINYFKIGEGGWIDPGSGAVPRTPDATLRRLDNSIQDLDCVVDPTRALIDQRYPGTSLYTFGKALTSADCTYEAPYTVRIDCFIDDVEGNDTGTAEFWEIGIFCDHPVSAGERLMIAYATFDKKTKTSAGSLTIPVRITF